MHLALLLHVEPASVGRQKRKRGLSLRASRKNESKQWFIPWPQSYCCPSKRQQLEATRPANPAHPLYSRPEQDARAETRGRQHLPEAAADLDDRPLRGHEAHRGLVSAHGGHVRRRRRGGARPGPARGGEAHEEGGAARRQLVRALRRRQVRRPRAAGTQPATKQATALVPFCSFSKNRESLGSRRKLRGFSCFLRVPFVRT